jgi:hypothetical protein
VSLRLAPLLLPDFLLSQLLQQPLVLGLIEEVDQVLILQGRVPWDGHIVQIEVEVAVKGDVLFLLGLVGHGHLAVGLKIGQFPAFFGRAASYFTLLLRSMLFTHRIIMQRFFPLSATSIPDLRHYPY